ncbi:hypothetical protein HK405_003578 [Cladochytrium tenue]|nr:hypothetical protein HK405_003578 [Cladochytrium tenue]
MVSVRSATATSVVAGVETDIAVTEFQNKILVVVTQQDGKIGGQLLLATREEDAVAGAAAIALSAPWSIPQDTTPTIEVRTLLGVRDDPVAIVFASHLLGWIVRRRPAEARPLLLSLALTGRGATERDASTTHAETLQGVVQLLESTSLF